ncbi:MAG: polyphosphate kinase 2 family protein [bacterium]|nr:polyphosphate kinase 2 family protein [bacterium]
MDTKRFLVRCGDENFDLRKLDPDFTDRFKSKEDVVQKLEENLVELRRLQDILFAQGQYGLLIILQGMDTSGKDSLSKYLMHGLNPAGCRVHSFKAPCVEELKQDFLRRYAVRVPARGEIVIFNRSHYEEVGVVRVHHELLAKQNLSLALRDRIWVNRFRQILDFERYLTENGVVVLKFFLHISKEEQEKRLLERIEDNTKNWKFSMRDVYERGFWEDYMLVYSQAIGATSTKSCPWYGGVPTNHKWFAKLVVGEVVIDHLQRLPLKYPHLDKKEHTEALTALKKSLKKV